MSDNHLPPGTKACNDCEAPVPLDGPKHASAGDCRAAQRKEIRRLRSENDNLQGRVDECGKMHGSEMRTTKNMRVNLPARQFVWRRRLGPWKSDDLIMYEKATAAGICTCRLVANTEDMNLRGRSCPKHG